MASAWGAAWGRAWGAAWGSILAPDASQPAGPALATAGWTPYEEEADEFDEEAIAVLCQAFMEVIA